MTNAENISHFGKTPEGRTVDQIHLRGGGLSLSLLTHGARVQDLRLDGVDHPLVLGADTLGPYLDQMLYYGAIVGRFANRIAEARFSLDGQEHRTDVNERGCQILHGGTDGTASHVWNIADVTQDSAVLTLTLPEGHMGFPGEIKITATYSLPGDAVLSLDIQATADQATPCSFAQHSYFALDGGTSVADQMLWIDADRYLPVDDTLIPTPEAPATVAETRFDFRTPTAIGTAGIDHNYCLNGPVGTLRRVARVSAPDGPDLVVLTDQPGLQVYDAGNQPDMTGLEGRSYGAFAGIALETQAWPDAPNRPDFPPAILHPGETYEHRVRYVFSAKS